MVIKVLVAGYQGKMGQVTTQMIDSDKQFELVGKVGKEDNLASAIQQFSPQVVIDLTNPQSVYQNACTIIAADVHPVIGTSGLSSEQIEQLTQRSEKKQLGGLIAPNFSIGMVLAMQYAARAARWLPDVEIIEMHHPAKQDAPSGTALKTADMIADSLDSKQNNRNPKKPVYEKIVSGARGALYRGIPIHAVRLPGLVAHQRMILGGEGQALTLHHDCFNRSAFMPGVRLACEHVMTLKTLVYGLEHLLR